MRARSITSARNPAVREARRLGRRGPAPDGAFLAEGPQALREGLDHLRRLFVTEDAARRERALVEAAAAAGADVLVVPDAVLDGLATTVHPQGVVGVADLPPRTVGEAVAGATLVVVLVEARDPGNVGTAIRTADAAGADAVVLAGTCVDPRNAKAVRASAGSLFHLPVGADPDPDAALRACADAGLRLVATAPRAALAHTGADLARPTALVFGSEAHGLPAGTRGRCEETVAVPLHGRAESLNLAATVAVVAYEAARQRERAGRGVLPA